MDVVLYVACSLDGFVAARDNGLDWLSRVNAPGEDYGYTAFYDSVDTVLLGSRTYEQIPSLTPAWPYAGKASYVFSSRALEAQSAEVTVTSESPRAVLESLEAEGRGRAWLVGGGRLVAGFREAGLVSEYIVSIIPVILGDGLPLFVGPGPEEGLRLAESRTYPSGLVQLRYLREEAGA